MSEAKPSMSMHSLMPTTPRHAHTSCKAPSWLSFWACHAIVSACILAHVLLPVQHEIQVFQVRHKKSGVIYAMKVMRKAKIHEAEHADYVKSERDVLTAVTHPYIVALRSSFQTPSKLYLVLDFLNGGHLFFNLYREGVFSEDVARLYSAEIVSAIAYLHSKNIMHRCGLIMACSYIELPPCLASRVHSMREPLLQYYDALGKIDCYFMTR